MIRKVSKRGLEALEEYVVLQGVSWKTYEAILDAIGEYHLRHTYSDGSLEFRRLLAGVSWDDYQKLLTATGSISLPHTYCDGWLEFMSPRQAHDWCKRLIGRMIEQATFELGIPIKSIGSTTISDPDSEAGFQPDEAYYLASESKVRFKEEFEPGVDPPPDLVLEVDVTSSSLKRMPVFAVAKIREVWRIRGKDVTFYGLTEQGKYRKLPQSLALPFLTPEDLTRFLELRHKLEEHELIRKFAEWSRKRKSEQSPQKNPKSSRRKDS